MHIPPIAVMIHACNGSRRTTSGNAKLVLRGVSLASAPKIVCLDTDDRLYPNALARYSSFLDKHPQGGVVDSILRRPFPSQACLRREAVPPAEWLGGQGCWGDWLLFEGAATNNKFAYIG